jgi:putative intracellular protease/amidase
MMINNLSGKKIAVLVESQYIPSEIKTYQERFAGYGAKVDLMSRLWGQPTQRFYSTVEPRDGDVPALEWLEVSIDFDQVNLGDYAAVIMAANYTSVRLRWNEASTTSQDPAGAARNTPAVRFFHSALQNRKVIKGAPCHALWLLTPVPDVLVGRRVTCNPVMLADVLNTGAIYVPAPAGSDWHQHVVVDDDLITSMSATRSNPEAMSGAEVFVDVIKDQILAREAVSTGL